MGGQSQQVKHDDQTSDPWNPAKGNLTDILGGLKGINPSLNPTQTGALDTLSQNAQGGNPWASQIGSVATGLLGGGPDRSGIVNNAYSQLQSNLAPTASGDYLDPNKNPWFAQTTKTIGDDIQNRVNSQFAGAGRDMSGYNTQTLSRGLAEGLAPTFANVYGQERQNQLGAGGTLFGAGGATAGLLSGMDQTKFGNQVAGAGLAGTALEAQNYGPMQQLLVEGQRQGIPLSVLQQMAGIAGPIAGLGGQKVGDSTQINQMSGVDQFAKLMGGGASSPVAGGANAASAALSLAKFLPMLCDRSHKTDIEEIGIDPQTGVMLYAFRYAADPKSYPKVVGPMADEVAEKYPQSVRQIGDVSVIDITKMVT